MRQLIAIDYVIIATYVFLALVIGNYFFKKAGESVESFFLSGRSMPWWLLGVSMAATNFSIDTPLGITKFISKYGVSGVWYYGAAGIGAMAAVFFFSKLWRRAEVITDNELIELRYSGRSASFLRLFKGIYFGVLINGFVLGWCFKALTKVSTTLTPWDPAVVLVFFGLVTLIYTVSGGFYGVVLTDFIQFVFSVSGSVLLAVFAVRSVGGVDALVDGLHALPSGASLTNVIPDMSASDQKMSFGAFAVLFLVQWWAHKYSDGGGKHIQRMSSAKNELHASWGTFCYSLFSFGMVLWPWIVTALCAMVVFTGIPDPERGYPLMMLKVLPHGLLGLCVMSMVGAFMSTVDTHLNLGASYFVNDIYRRFLKKDASDEHYVKASRWAIIGIMVLSIILSTFITSIGSFYIFVLTFASGAGLTWVLRWFWWRVNAYSELSAMVTSSVVATSLNVFYPEMTFSNSLLVIISISTPVFLITTFLTAPSDEETLKSFFERVRPCRWGWKPIIEKYDLSYEPYFKPALLNFALGVVLLMSFHFGMGQLLFASTELGVFLLCCVLALILFLAQRLRGTHEPSSQAVRSLKEIKLRESES